ncbi:hypothetical protein Tco_0357512 [Tanacetum coccineum]
MPVSKKKEMVDVAKDKGIELLSDVALTEEAQYEEVRKKSLKGFPIRTHPSGSGTATKSTPSFAIIKPSVTNEGTGVKPGVPDVTEVESSESEAESWGNDDDDSNNDQDSENDEDETNIADNAEEYWKVPLSSSSHSSDLVAKFLNFSDIPTTEAEIVSPMDVYVHHEVPRK